MFLSGFNTSLNLNDSIIQYLFSFVTVKKYGNSFTFA